MLLCSSLLDWSMSRHATATTGKRRFNLKHLPVFFDCPCETALHHLGFTARWWGSEKNLTSPQKLLLRCRRLFFHSPAIDPFHTHHSNSFLLVLGYDSWSWTNYCRCMSLHHHLNHITNTVGQPEPRCAKGRNVGDHHSSPSIYYPPGTVTRRPNWVFGGCPVRELLLFITPDNSWIGSPAVWS